MTWRKEQEQKEYVKAGLPKINPVFDEWFADWARQMLPKPKETKEGN